MVMLFVANETVSKREKFLDYRLFYVVQRSETTPQFMAGNVGNIHELAILIIGVCPLLVSISPISWYSYRRYAKAGSVGSGESGWQ